MKRFTISIFLISSLLAVGLIYFSEIEPTAITGKYVKVTKAYHSAEPNDKEFYDTVYSFNKNMLDLEGRKPVAGIVPHHLLAGDMIAEFYENLKEHEYDTVVMLGPNHFMSGEAELITSIYDWQTPFGTLECDSEIISSLEREYATLGIEPEVVDREHAMTSHVGFIKKTFPNARFVPLLLHPNIDSSGAKVLAMNLDKIMTNKQVLVLASADFAHYTDSETASLYDKKSIQVLSDMELSEVYGIEVDSPSAIYTILSFAKINVAGFELLNNSNSALLSGKEDIEETTSYITGFFVEENIRMLFFGDMMLDRYVGDRIEENGFEYLLEELDKSGFFSDYDIISANLEGTVTDDGKYYAPVKKYDFAFKPEQVQKLKDYGINFFSLSNNHFADQGDKGMLETRKNLDELGFMYAGCYSGMVADCSVSTIEINDKKIGMVALSTTGTNINQAKIKELINDAAEKNDFVIVNIHWGEEYEKQFDFSQENLAHNLVDEGADMIIGHHPHVIQGVEIYKNKPIFYSLGNFIFDQYFSVEAQKELALEVEIGYNNLTISLHPLTSNLSQVQLMSENDKLEVLENIVEISNLDTEYKKQVLLGEIKINK